MRKFLLDTVLCSLFIFSLIGLFSSVAYFKIFDVFDPIGDMFADFEITDLVMSQLRVAPPVDDEIIVVNDGYADREEMAKMIQIIQKYDPAVIGLDHEFHARKTFSEDSLFIETLKKYDNIVLGSSLRMFNEQTNQFDTLLLPEKRIAQHADFGFANLLTNAASQTDLKMNREFVTRQYVKGMTEEQFAFSIKLAEYKSPGLTRKFLDRNKEIEVINYKGNVFDYGQSDFGTRYYVLDRHEIFNENFTTDLFEDKVVILCFLGAYLGDKNTRDDLYFTPLNKRYVGKAEPDMFGGVIHANIISMILQEDYVDQMSNAFSIGLAIFICLVNVFLFKIIYAALPKWYDGITKLAQLFQILILVLIMVILFDQFTYKADFTLAIIVIALSGDSIEVYHGVVKNLFSKSRRRELFQIKRRFWEQ